MNNYHKLDSRNKHKSTKLTKNTYYPTSNKNHRQNQEITSTICKIVFHHYQIKIKILIQDMIETNKIKIKGILNQLMNKNLKNHNKN